MKWSYEKPTQPGWYWLRDASLSDEYVVVPVEFGYNDIIITGPKKLKVRHESGTWSDVEKVGPEHQWAGPIPFPAESKKTSVDRAVELMSVPAKDLPPIALAFRNQLCSELGMCMEVCLTAFAVYANLVEGLECDDAAYAPRGVDVEWFATHICNR
jgi:hypothetical protein